jgi:DNA-binding transcriptional LysR family regulator
VIEAAVDGAGLAWVAEDRITEHLASGALVRVLEDWCLPFPGFFLYYPSRRSDRPLSRRSSARYDWRRASGVSDSKVLKIRWSAVGTH